MASRGPRFLGLKVPPGALLGVSEQTARSCTKKLEEAGWIRTVSRRPLRFALGEAGVSLLEGGESFLA